MTLLASIAAPVTGLVSFVPADALSTAPALAAMERPVADFSDTPWWLSLIKAILVFVYLMLSVVVMIWFERRVVGRMQQRGLDGTTDGTR